MSSLGPGGMAIGGSADYQAQRLRDERGVTLPLLLDPTHAVREAVGTRVGDYPSLDDVRSALVAL